MTAWLIKYLGPNWKTNSAAAASFVLSVPAVVTAITAWAHHQPADWRGAILGVVLGLGLYFAKDATNHSTIQQVEAATVKADVAKEKP